MILCMLHTLMCMYMFLWFLLHNYVRVRDYEQYVERCVLRKNLILSLKCVRYNINSLDLALFY